MSRVKQLFVLTGMGPLADRRLLTPLLTIPVADECFSRGRRSSQYATDVGTLANVD